MFDDLKQNNQGRVNTVLPENTNSPAAKSSTDDMFGDIDPVADKVSAVQAGRMRPVNTSSLPVTPNISSPAASAPQPIPSALLGDDFVGQERRQRPNRKMLFVVIGIFLAVGLALGAYAFFSNRLDLENVNALVNNTNTAANDIVSNDTNDNSNDNLEPTIDDPELADDDKDGLSNGEEKDWRTNPLLADTDNDRLFDQDEVEVYNTNPLINDSDNDSLQDYDEVITWSTDPNEIDSDGDGYGDGVEVNSGYNPLGPGTIDQWSPPSPSDLFNR